MKSILFIHQSADLYGSDKTLLMLLQHLDKNRFKPVVVIPIDGPLKTELENINVEVHIAPVLKLYRNIFKPKNILKFFSEYKAAVKFLDDLNKKHHFDIIYSNTLAVLLGMIYAKKRNIHHIWHVHEIIVHPKIIANTFPKLLHKYTDVIVCNSKATQDNLINRVSGIKSKSVVIHNGVQSTNQIGAHALKTDFGFDNKDLILTLVGRINRLKGHKLVLEVFQNYFLNQKNVKLLFVGSPVPGQESYLHEVEKIICENKLDDRVKILPFTKNLAQIWDITDIALIPSTEAESFGLVAVEAMLSQKPVIGSNHGGVTEIIIHNETGLLFKPNDGHALYEALDQLIQNPEKRAIMGRNGFERATETFSLYRYIQNFENLFLTLK